MDIRRLSALGIVWNIQCKHIYNLANLKVKTFHYNYMYICIKFLTKRPFFLN